MVDHIEEIITFAVKNIKKKDKYFIDQNRIVPLTIDGRKGYANGGPYDVIHLGGAID